MRPELPTPAAIVDRGRSELKQSLINNAKTIVYALLIAGLFRTLFFQPFFIPSGSMKETLLVGDFLFVNKMAYGYSRHSCPWSMCPFSGRLLASEPERGDIIVFKHPVSGQDYIKRLVGLPGDRISVEDGVLHINNAPMPVAEDGAFVEPFLPQGRAGSYPRCANRPARGEDCVKHRFVEAFPESGPHTILNITDQGFGDNTLTYLVPQGEYFFLGDNRDNSQDSRVAQSFGGIGTVPFENLLGRADRVVFSSEGRSLLYFWTWRKDRIFKALE